MSKFLRKCGFFMVLLIVLNLIYLFFLLLFSPGFKKVYEISEFKNQNFEVLVLGNSMALDGIDASYLSENGISAYNLSVAGDHSSTSLMILEEYLKNNQKPKMVLIGLSSSIGNSYLNKMPFKNPEVEFFYNPNLLANITNPPLLNFQWLVVDFMKILFSKDHRNAKMVFGQWQTKKAIADNSVYKEKGVPVLNYKDPYLYKMVYLCKRKGIQVLLMELPGSNDKRNSLPLVYNATLLDGKKVPIYNLNNYEVSSKILDSSKDWLASDHLNQYGARKITDYMLRNTIKKDIRFKTAVTE